MGRTAKSHTDQDEVIGRQLHRVKQKLYEETHIKSHKNSVGKLLSKGNLFKGKLIRPRLVLLSAKLCEPDEKRELPRLTIETAAAIELLHNATLLHDDVIDQAGKRRNMETLNFAEGNQAAVLGGDFLLARVFRMCAGFPPSVTEIISRAAARTCTGEIAQIAQSGNQGLSEKEYLKIITDKTAAVFACCFQLGGVTEDSGINLQKKLAEIGEDIGIAYQLSDDLFDIIGSERSEGKTLGTDAVNNKLTLPVIHFLENADEKRKSAFYDNLKDNPNEFMINELSKTGSLVYTQDKITDYIKRAEKKLDTFPYSQPGEQIKKICLEIRRKSETELTKKG
jgi:geranylgeranyl pyrophosphate synthase